MSNEILDILGLNKNALKPKAPEPLKIVRNRTQNAIDYTRERALNAQEQFGKMSRTNQMLLIGGILAMILMIGLIYKLYRDQKKREKFLSQPVFMTGIEQNRPHNAKTVYRYVDPNTGKATSYIPGYYFNERNGTQYTFSFWMFVDGKEWNYRFGEWKHIFHRGTAPTLPLDNSDISNENITKLNTQLPGFWLAPKENTLNCTLTTGEFGEERITIEDIPMNKWINIVLVVNHTSASLYLDGKLHRTINLLNKISSTKDGVYVNYFGGFGGKMAYLQFFDKALAPQEIQSMYQQFKQEQIDKNIRSMFDKEIFGMSLPIGVDKQKCNYMQKIKQERDKEEYIKKILEVNKILCQNTKNITEAECNNQNKLLNKFIDKGIPITDLKDMLKKMVGNIKSMDRDEYQYIDDNNRKRIAYLSKKDYDKIKNL